MIVPLNDCDCFTGIQVSTPRSLFNLPGLAAIGYRVGTHSTFKRSMLANLSILSQLPSQSSPGALVELLTRQDDDFAIAFLDAWATVADILTFYQERIANENYLRTATELRSVLHLAREIGYELNPGVAAGTVLAFTMDSPQAPPAVATPQPGTTLLPSTVVVPVATKVQSVPDPGQTPVTFETIAPIPARAEWNQLRPSQTVPQSLDWSLTSVRFAGIATNIKPGDGLLVMANGYPTFGIAGKVTPIPGTAPGDPGTTSVEFQVQTDMLNQFDPVNWYQPADPPLGVAISQLPTTSMSEDELQAWADRYAINVADLFSDLRQGAPAPFQAIAFRLRAAIFGHNAPEFDALPPSLTNYQQKTTDTTPTTVWVAGPYQGRDKWTDTSLSDYWTLRVKLGGGGVLLDTSYPQLTTNGFVVLRVIGTYTNQWARYQITDAADVSWTDFTLSAKVSRLGLDSDHALLGMTIKTTAVYAQSEWLALADLPDTSPVTGTTVLLDGWAEGLQVGQQVVVQGESADAPGTRIVETPKLLAIEHVLTRRGGTQLTFSPGLQNNYVRSTVLINANAGPATHGESVQEFAGSGDATQPFQTFKLRQPPLTYTAAETPTGGASTLNLWVNDVRWREVPSLIDSGPKDRVYTVRLDDNQVPTIEGGDGITGSRLPTGQENIRAVYRKGTGLAGEVRAGQLTLLSTRPLGVKGVTNPVPAGGAQDFEQLSDARANASVSILTLGRVVSLLDYQNFARAFGGVGKAVAAWSHLGQTRGVAVTVAGSGGKVLDPEGQTCTHLLGALLSAGEPYVPIRVVPHQAVSFQVSLQVDFDPSHVRDKVEAAVVTALRSAFSFQARSFGQGVAVSEVTAVVQAIDGVVAVSVQQLYRSGAPPSLPSNGVLTASLSAAGGDIRALNGAELLTLDSGPVQVGTF